MDHPEFTNLLSFTCKICLNKFSSQQTLERHQHREEDGESKHVCERCNKSFTSKCDLAVHFQLHISETRSQLKNAELYEKHNSNVSLVSSLKQAEPSRLEGNDTKEGMPECIICYKRFPSVGKLKQHFVLHYDQDKIHTCHVCQKPFMNKSHFDRHYRSHSGEKPYTCEICHKSFSLVDNMKRHKLIHSEKKEFFCHHCGKDFRYRGDLERHVRVHTGEKPHTCEVCNESFARIESLKRHLTVHTGEKPYKCDVCTQEFSQVRSLKRHTRTFHR